MSEVTTAYKIRLFFKMDRARSTLDFFDRLGNRAKKAGNETGMLSGRLKTIGASLAGGAGLAVAKKSFVDFNSEMEGMRIGMASLLQMNLGGYFTDASTMAQRLVGDFQQIAKASVGTTKDFVSFANAVAAPVLQANLGLGTTAQRLEQLKKITAGGVVGATVLGEDPELAQRDIEQWLNGTLTTVDRFSKKLLAPMGLTHTQLNAKSAKDRLGLLEKALTQPAVQEATKAYANSWAGISSTMEDTLQMMAGSAGLGVFKAISKEVQSWNTWIEQNPKAIENFTKTIGDTLVKAFQTAKDVFGWLYQNKDLLLTLAKAALITKGVGVAGSLVSGPFRSLAGLADRFAGLGKAAEEASKGTASFADRMTGVANKLSGLFMAGGAVAGLASGIADVMLDMEQRRLDKMVDLGYLRSLASGGGEARAMANRGRSMPQTQAHDSWVRGVIKEATETGVVTGRSINAAGVGAMFGGNAMSGPQLLGGMRKMMGFSEARALLGGGTVTDGTGREFSKKDLDAGQLRLFELTYNRVFAKEIEFVARMEKVLLDDVDVKRRQNEAFLMSWGMKMSDFMDPTRMAAVVNTFTYELIRAAEEGMGAKSAVPKRRDTNININKVEVIADDPDRLVMGVLAAVDDAVRNPSTPSGTYRDS